MSTNNILEKEKKIPVLEIYLLFSWSFGEVSGVSEKDFSLGSSTDSSQPGPQQWATERDVPPE